MQHPTAETRTPTVADLFMGFFWAGVMGFGGVLPLARRMVVEERRWLSPAEFNDLLALCQFLPGPNICNMCIGLGYRYRGLSGALAAVTGLLAMPIVIVIGLGGLYARYGELPLVRHAFTGLAAAASGLVVATACKIAWPIRHRATAVGIAAVVFAAIALLHLPLLPTMLAVAPLSVLLVRRWG